MIFCGPCFLIRSAVYPNWARLLFPHTDGYQKSQWPPKTFISIRLRRCVIDIFFVSVKNPDTQISNRPEEKVRSQQLLPRPDGLPGRRGPPDTSPGTTPLAYATPARRLPGYPHFFFDFFLVFALPLVLFLVLSSAAIRWDVCCAATLSSS